MASDPPPETEPETEPNPAPQPSKKKRRLLGCLGALGIFLLLVFWIYGGGGHQEPGSIAGSALPASVVEARRARVAAAAPEGAGEAQILFGDLHVHTTYSADAFMRSVPLLGGEGAHPPADTCDFARYCSNLDFYALTDHAAALTPRHWRESMESIRQCNATAGDAADPDLVAFPGFEWTQVGPTPEEHYGHKNVIFRLDDEAHLPARPIAATGVVASAMQQLPLSRALTLPLLPILEFSVRERYLDIAYFMRENQALSACPEGIDTRELPPDCRESAATPRVLFDKLDQWGFDAMVIPHGSTWGFYTPPGYDWDKQLAPELSDPERQRLIEVYSGHGNSEEYRGYRAGHLSEAGEPVCPEPTEGYEACCWRAGEIIRGRCGEVSSEECERRVTEARSNYVRMGVTGHLSVPGAEVEDWGNCGNCTDCFNPAFQSRPGGSAQYILARGRFEEGQEPQHAVFGFIASSDNHTARPGTGYKEYERRRNTEATGAISREWRQRVFGETEEATAESRFISREELLTRPAFRLVDIERQASFFMTGGLVAVHSEGRGRDAIWEALQQRRVYGTSGDRILLWFDLVNAPEGSRPMGSELRMGDPPRFRVRAAGAFEQLPGCPEGAEEALGAERLERLCLGECYHPSDTRRRITRVEVVRIRPQVREEEEIGGLIEDPFRTLPCPEGEEICQVEFEDPEFASFERRVIYYVRAIQEPTPAVNAGGARCSGEGCDPCYGDYRTPLDDDCLSDNEERAWSSPIWVDYDASLRTPEPEPAEPEPAETEPAEGE